MASASYLDNDWPVLSEVTALNLPLKAWMGEGTQGKPWAMCRPYRLTVTKSTIDQHPILSTGYFLLFLVESTIISPRRIDYYFEEKKYPQ